MLQKTIISLIMWLALLGIAPFLIALFFTPLLRMFLTPPLQLEWLINLLLIGVLLVIIGYVNTCRQSKTGSGRLSGIFIDDRKKFSLSRLQLVLWTAVIFSAWFTLAAGRVAGNPFNAALEVNIPSEILWILGISAASPVGAQIIKKNDKNASETNEHVEILQKRIESNEEKKKVIKKAAKDIENTVNFDGDNVDHAIEAVNDGQVKHRLNAYYDDFKLIGQQVETERGVLKAHREGSQHVNKKIGEAHWSNLFTAESIDNYQSTDIGKVQMYLITIVLIIAYSTLIWTQLSDHEAVDSLPAVSESMVTLLGISHAGYLANKQAT